MGGFLSDFSSEVACFIVVDWNHWLIVETLAEGYVKFCKRRLHALENTTTTNSYFLISVILEREFSAQMNP